MHVSSRPADLCTHTRICTGCVPVTPGAGVLVVSWRFNGSSAVAGAQCPPSSGSLKGTHLRLGCACSMAGLGVTPQDVSLGWGQGGRPRPALCSVQASHCMVRARPLKRESSSEGCSRSEAGGAGLLASVSDSGPLSLGHTRDPSRPQGLETWSVGEHGREGLCKGRDTGWPSIWTEERRGSWPFRYPGVTGSPGCATSVSGVLSVSAPR